MHAAQWSFVGMCGAALCLILLERRFPYTRGQRLFREGFWTDIIGYTVIQSLVLGVVIEALARLTAERTDFRGVGHWPVAAQFVFFFVIHDFYIYWFHRLQHRFDFLWRFHEAHHSVRDVDWLSGTRSHACEILVNQSVEFVPLAVFGAAPEVVVLKACVDAIWGMYIHSNVAVKSGWLQVLLNGPEMHRWHHCRDIPAPGVNFSTKLAIWDWLFGTAYLPSSRAGHYGLDDPEFPLQGTWAYLKQQLYAFRPSSTALPEANPSLAKTPH